MSISRGASARAGPRARPRAGPRAGEATGGAADGASQHAIELLYIDSSHDRDETITEVQAWKGALAPGALIVFDDYTHPDYPGVREAIVELGLCGVSTGTLYVVTVAAASLRT